MSLAAIIRRRQDALLKPWSRDPSIQVQAESPDVLPRLVFWEVFGEGAFIAPVGRRNTKNTVLVRRTGNPDSNACIWVAAGYSGYRAAYLDFVREVYGISAASSDLNGYDVDHLLNRARSPDAATFIRIEAIPSVANQAWGRLFERAASDPKFYATRERRRRTMSWMICAKLAGKLPPLGPNDAGGIALLAAFFQSIGIDYGEAEKGLKSMLNHAYQFQ